MRVGSFSTRGIALFVFVLAVIAALFFIPEIIRFQKGLSADKKKPLVAAAVSQQVETVEVAKKEEIKDVTAPVVLKSQTPSIIDRFVSYFKSDRGITPVELRRATELAQSKIGSKNSLTTPQAISWASIRGPQSVANLKRAHDDSITLARSIPAKYPETTYALYAFAGGIKYVLGSAEKAMSAEKAFAFLVQLDQNVSETMLSEKVPAADYNVWSQISLGPLFARVRSMANKAKHQMPFNPQLRIVTLKVVQPGTTSRKFLENARSYIRLAGVVEGQDVQRVEVYQDGIRLKDRTLQKADKIGRKSFTVQGLEARGIYTFRAISKGGQTYTKSYNFYNRARQFPWLASKSGRFIIPYNNYDPRLDSLFLVADVDRQAPGVSFFSSAVGKDFATF